MSSIAMQGLWTESLFFGKKLEKSDIDLKRKALLNSFRITDALLILRSKKDRI